MSNGAIDLKLIVDILADQVAIVEQDFKDEGYSVAAKKQASGLWSVAAAK